MALLLFSPFTQASTPHQPESYLHASGQNPIHTKALHLNSFSNKLVLRDPLPLVGRGFFYIRDSQGV